MFMLLVIITFLKSINIQFAIKITQLITILVFTLTYYMAIPMWKFLNYNNTKQARVVESIFFENRHNQSVAILDLEEGESIMVNV